MEHYDELYAGFPSLSDTEIDEMISVERLK